jgi:DNA-binding NtrC family response regulator
MCNGMLAQTGEEGFICMRCRSEARYRGGELLAMKIPGYELRLEELRRRHAEILALIEAESGKGSARDMRILRSLHEERQRVLSEFSFMGYFRQFVERWQER